MPLLHHLPRGGVPVRLH